MQEKQETSAGSVKEKLSVSDVLWNEIRNKSLDIFALPRQKVEGHCTRVDLEPKKLYLTLKSPAVLPALETALGENYKVEVTNKFIVITRAEDVF